MAHSDTPADDEHRTVENLPVDYQDDGTPELTEEWEGVMLSATWGYGQTNLDLARIIEVSDSGRTVVAKLGTAETVDAVRGCEKVVPAENTYGDTFRLYVRSSSGDGVYFRGSYPYIQGDSEKGTRRETFTPVDGQTLTRTPTNQGH